jgi:ATP-dependent helicase/nuclease subunit A
VPEDIREQINKVRDSVKKTIRDEIKGTFFIFSSDEIIQDNEIIYNNLDKLIKLDLEFVSILQTKKLEKNVLDFSDIEHYANKLLNDYEEIAKFYKDKFVEILIDEYQDSNLLQESILTAISNDKMFMVGDVKQSIYRFRNARPELFLEKYDTYEETEEALNKKVLLFKNFRSNENIVNEVNYIFERIMSKDFGELDYTEKEFLKFGADCYSKIGEPAELTFIETNLNDETLELPEEAIFDTTANMEGRYIAKRIKELVGNLTIFDKSLKCERKAQYKDIAILLRSTKGKADGIIEELSNVGIPVYSEKGGSYFDNTEVQTILSVLRIIDNPIQDIPLVAVMRSQIGGFNIDELTSIRLCDRKSSFYDATIKCLNQENELSAKVKTFLDKLHRWREISKHISLWELLWQIYNETGYYYYVSLFPDGLKRQSNLNLLLERAEAFEKTSFKGLFNFLSYIDNIKETSADFGESKQIGENENVVRLMSVHKSKGLEFPIVILAGTEKRFNISEYSENIILDQDYGFGVDVIDYEKRYKYANISKHAITVKSKMDSVAEEMRILYVALTRAREKLIVTGLVPSIQDALTKYGTDITKYKISKAHSFLDWLGLCIVNKISDWNVIKVPFEDSYTNVEATIGRQAEENDVAVTNGRQDDDTSMYDYVDRQMSWIYHNDIATKLPNKVSISELKRAHIEEDESSSLLEKNNVKQLITMPSFLSDDEEDGTKYGTIVHGTMQRIDFKNYTEDEALKAIKFLTNDEKTQNSILRKVKAFSNTELFNDLKEAKSVYKETPFNLNISAKDIYKVETDEKVMIQGIIDLYFIDKEDNLVLVDYKTDKVEAEQELVDRYKIQLGLYKKALEEILNKPVSRTLIYSFKFEKAIEI